MKTFTLVLLAFIGLNIIAHGQNDLLLVKKKNGREKIINEGKRIKVFTYNGLSFKGRYKSEDKDLLIFGQDTVKIENIEIIRTKSWMSIPIGITFIAGGGLLIFAGVSVIQGGYIILSVVGIYFVGQGVISTISGVLFLSLGNKYRSDKWDFMYK